MLMTVWTPALFITRRSIGDFDLLKRSLKAERLTFAGRNEEAAIELQAAIAANASATSLVNEMRADLLLLKRNASDSAALIEEIKTYAAEHRAVIKLPTCSNCASICSKRRARPGLK